MKASVRMPTLEGADWFNSFPVGRADLQGRVVLVEFWTYSCVNCLRVLPHLNDLWTRYGNRNFLVIGVHSPEFSFEKDRANVARAIERLQVKWPVVLDNDYTNWDNFANHYWPAMYLSDHEGRIVYSRFGEGGYAETEAKVQELLREVSPGPLPAVEPDRPRRCVSATPEIYCGYGRGILGNPGGYIYEREADYAAPRSMRQDSIALDGRFLAARERIESREPGASLLLSFTATEVNLVMDPARDGTVVRVTLDGITPDPTMPGDDTDPGGHVHVDEPRMYNLLRAARPVSGVLSIQALEGDFRAYAFTFSATL